MVPKAVLEEIDRTIKEIWLNDIPRDYWAENILKEEGLKCCLYYHLRRKLRKLLNQYDLRIYPEFYFPDLKYRADIAIAELDMEKDVRYLGDAVRDVIAIFELKLTGGASKSTEEWVKRDVRKIKDYIQSGRLMCQYYFAVIYETECSGPRWLDKRSSNNWACGYVTELDARRLSGEITFEVHAYNNMNPQFAQEMK